MTDRPSVALRQVGPRGTAETSAGSNALKNAITGVLSEGAEAFVAATRSVYRWKPGDQTSALLGEAILPAPLDTGRWNEHAAEFVLDRVLTAELAADVVLAPGQLVELLSITVTAVGRRHVDAFGDLSATWTNNGDLELQVYVSIDGGVFTRVNAGAVQQGLTGDIRTLSVGATTGPFPVATETVAVSLRLRNGLASSVTVSPAGGNAVSLRVQTRREGIGAAEPGILWCGAGIGNSNSIGPAIAYLPSQLDAPTPSMPQVAITMESAQCRGQRMRAQPGTNKIWFYAQGTSTTGGSFLVRFSRNQLGYSGSPRPEVVIRLNPVTGGATYPVDFDFVESTGRCFVVTQQTIRGYDTADLLVSGAPAPAIILSVAGAAVQQGILVDGDDIWVGDFSPSRVFKLSAAQLNGAGGVVVPTVMLSGSNMAGGVEFMTFDAQGNMWVTFYSVNEARKYNAADLLVSGNPVPSVVIDLPEATGACGIVFDDEGNMFVGNFDNGRIYKILAANLLVSGPAVTSLLLTSDALQASNTTLTFDRGTA